MHFVLEYGLCDSSSLNGRSLVIAPACDAGTVFSKIGKEGNFNFHFLRRGKRCDHDCHLMFRGMDLFAENPVCDHSNDNIDSVVDGGRAIG